MTLVEIDLPAGDIAPFDVEWDIGNSGTNRHNYTYRHVGTNDGIVFTGKGPGVTHIRPTVGTSTSWDSTVFIGPNAGHVEFRDLTLHCATRKGIHAGLEAKGQRTEATGLILRLTNVTIVADEPTDNRPISTVWGVFTYAASLDLKGVDFYMEHSAEHACYAHGMGRDGIRWEDCTVHAVGGEGLKASTRPFEVPWTRAMVQVKNCIFKNWYQDWSWRGGGGIVLQGTGANVIISRCQFYPRILDATHSKCIMIDEGGQARPTANGLQHRYYSAIDGTPSGGPANGYVQVKDCVLHGKGPSWYSPIMRVGHLDRPDHPVVRGLHIKDTGLYGYHTTMQLGNELTIPEESLVLDGLNSRSVKDWVAVNTDVSVEYPTTLQYKDRFEEIGNNVKVKP